jgi:hypothetical protein
MNNQIFAGQNPDTDRAGQPGLKLLENCGTLCERKEGGLKGLYNKMKRKTTNGNCFKEMLFTLTYHPCSII